MVRIEEYAQGETPWEIKISRARSHMDELNDLVNEYQKPTNIKVTQHEIPGEGGKRRYEWNLQIRSPLPSHWSAIVGDVVSNLRSALDTVAFAVITELASRQGIFAKEANIQFPFGKVFESQSKWRWNGDVFDEELVKILKEIMENSEGAIWLNGYPGEGQYVSALSQLQAFSNEDKHRRLVAITGTISGFKVGHLSLDPFVVTLTDPETWRWPGATLGSVPYNATSGVAPQVNSFTPAVYLGLETPQWSEDHDPIMIQLEAIAMAVDDAIRKIELYRQNASRGTKARKRIKNGGK